MAFDFSNITDEELEAMAAQSAPASEPMPQKPLSEWTDEELEAYASEPTPAPAQSAAHSPRMTREERIAANNRAIETARSQEDPGFLSAAGEAIAEGAKGAARAVKSIGSGIVGMASGAVRLAGTPVRLATGWEGLHRLADTIDSSYENFGADALMSDYGENPDGFGFAAGRFGEKLAGTAGSLAALGGVGKAVGAAGTALKAAGHAKTAAAVANTLPLMFGNDAAVRAYDTARANGKSKGESAALAGLNGAIHFLGFKAFENKALNKMLGMPAEMEGLMPKWAGEAAEAGEQSFSSLARGVRNGMIKYTLAERGKGALKAGGIMGLQDMLSDPVMQVAEGASIDDIDFTRMLKAGASGLGEGALMEGALGAASVLKSPSEARKFIADKIFRGKDYKVRGSDGKMHDEPGLLNTSEGRMVLMKQNPDATERVLDIVEHGGTPRPAELDAAFLPPDMTAEELKKFASDWRNDLKPYVDEAWAADAPRQTAAPDAAAEPGRDMLSPEEAQSQQKAANDAAERQKVADRRAAADSMMLDFESWNRLYADGKTDLNFDEWRAAGKPGVIEANLTPKTEEAPTSETRANEEPAQPEQAEVVAPPAGAEARPVEGAEARAEAADARVVESPAKPAEAAQKPAEAAAEPKVGKDTPAPVKPAEAASRVSYATPERKAPVAEAEDAPLPSFLAPDEAPAKEAPAEPPAPKSNRLRRADGTDPLVTPAPTGEVASPEPTPASVKRGKGRPTMTPEQKAKAAAKRAADKVRKIADISRDESGAFRTDMLKASESNPGGLSLKELASLKADKEWHRNLGLPEKDADALRAAVEKAHDDKYLEYHYQSAHDKFADYERGNGDLAFAYNAVSDAASRAKTKGDTVGEQLLQPMLKSLTDKIGALPKNEQNKILAKSSREADTLAPKERKNRKSLTTKEGKEVDVATSGEVAEAGEAEEAPDEYGAGSRFNRIEANDDDSSGRSAPKGATGTGGSLGGNRHLIIDGVKGDELTVTMKDAAGKTIATRKINRAQWSALSQGAVATDGDPANPQKGDLIRTSRSDATDAPQSWTPEAKKPLERVAHTLRNVVTVGGKRLKVSFVDRPEDADGQTRKSISGVFTGSTADYANRSRQGGVDDGPSLHKIGTGEGTQVYGHGLYGSSLRNDAEYYAAKAQGNYVPWRGGDGRQRIYEQTFFTNRPKGDESHLLSWYEPVSAENKQRVDKALQAISGNRMDWDGVRTGEDLYRKLANFASPEEASKFLAENAGIDGIKYPAEDHHGRSIGNGKGWNYVSFRDDNIRVDHKWEDGQMRYMRNGDGEVVGEYDAAKGEIRLYPGATVADVVHEFTHPLVDFARAEAKAGRGELLGKINQIIDAERATWEQPVREAYKDKSNETILEEIFTHAMGEKGADLFGKSTKTLQGRRWYNRLWEAIKGVWQDFATKMGWNKADLRGLDRMSPEDAAQKILSEMAKGRNFGDAKTLGRLEAQSSDGARMARGPVTPDPNVRLMDDEVKWLDRQGERFVDSTHNLHRLQDEVGYRDRSKSGSVGVEEVMDPKTGFVDWRRSTDIQKAIVKSNGFAQKHEHILQIRRDKATREMAKMKGLSEDAKRELVDNYLIALHAEERNRTIADRRGDKYNDDYAEGAGRSEKWARKFIADDPNVQKYKAELDKIADIVHEAVMEDLRLRHENGLLSDDEYNFYSKKWKHYVPLRTDLTEGSPEGGAFNTSTATFNRSEYRTAKGRGADNIASSPFAFAFVQAHDGIGKSAKNIIGNVTANFIDMTEAKGLNSTKVEVVAKDGSKSMKNEYRIAEVVPAEVVRRGGTKFAATFADGSTAEIGSDMRLASHQDNLVLFKRPEPVLGKDGKPTGKTAAQLFVAKFTEGKNGRGTAIAKAITGKNMVEVPFWVQPFSKATQFLSRMNTSASPSFLTSNIFNDRNEAWRTMSARFGILDGAKMAAKVWKYRYADSKDLKNWLKNGELRPGSDVADFINGGAAIKGGNVAQGFSGELSSLKDNLARQERKARSWLERFKRIGRFENVREIASSVGDVVRSANELEELGTRYGVYHAVLDELVAKGVPREVAKAEAVTFCRGATTDFNVRGTLAPIIGSFYMFYNANVQGTRRNIQSLTDKHGVQTFATLATIASAMTVMRYWLGNDDEREKGGERNAKNALEYQKQSAMGIPIPSGRELSILKMRGVDSLIPYAATKFTEAALYDDVSAMEALGDALKAVAGEMFGVLGGNGVGNKSQISQTLAPSLADPFIQWATGTDWQGERRVKQVIDKTVPQSYNARHGTSGMFKWIAETVNDISGGNQYRRGVVDMAPEDVQLIVETLAGGLGRDITGAINTYSNVKEIAQGGSSERLFGKMPVVKSLVREYPDSTSRYYDALEDYERDKAEFKKTTPERRREMKSEKPYLFTGKSLLDGQIERIKELTHLERGEVKVGQKWVEPKTPRTEEQKEKYRKLRLEMQARVLKRLGE